VAKRILEPDASASFPLRSYRAVLDRADDLLLAAAASLKGNRIGAATRDVNVAADLLIETARKMRVLEPA